MDGFSPYPSEILVRDPMLKKKKIGISAPWHSDDWPGLLCWLFWHASTERCWTSSTERWGDSRRYLAQESASVEYHWSIHTDIFTCQMHFKAKKMEVWADSRIIWTPWCKLLLSFPQSPKPHPARHPPLALVLSGVFSAAEVCTFRGTSWNWRRFSASSNRGGGVFGEWLLGST